MAGLGWLVVQQVRARVNRGLEAASLALVLGTGFGICLGTVSVYAVATGPIAIGSTEMSGAFGAALASSVVWAWFSGAARPSPAFSKSDIQWLMTAPLRRRDLVAYRLGVSQPSVLGLGAVTMLACLSLGVPQAVWSGIGLTVLLELMLLNQLFAACTHARLAALGIGLVGRVAVAMLLAYLGIRTFFRHAGGAPPMSTSDPAHALRWLAEQVAAVPLLNDIALLPASTGHIHGLFSASAVAAAMWIGIVLLDGPFEEHALQASRPAESARQIIPLRARGPIWEAFVWVGLVSTLRIAMRSAPILVLGAVGAASLVQAQADSSHRDLQVFLTYSVGLITLAPTFIQSDLHDTLRRATWLFVLPVRTRDLVRGSVLSGVVATMPVQVAFILSAVLYVPTMTVGQPLTRPVVAVTSLLAVGATTYLAFAISNAMVAAWPHWLRHSGEEASGLENVGRLVSATTVRNCFMWAALLPVLTVAAGVAVVCRSVDPRLAIAAWGLVFGAGTVVLAEWVVIRTATRLETRASELL